MLPKSVLILPDTYSTPSPGLIHTKDNERGRKKANGTGYTDMPGFPLPPGQGLKYLWGRFILSKTGSGDVTFRWQHALRLRYRAHSVDVSQCDVGCRMNG